MNLMLIKRIRRGKIARCPAVIRDEVNRRLHDGETGKEVVAWLNEQPLVQSMLARKYAGAPITEQNLSKWRRGGFQNWLSLVELAQVESLLRTRVAPQSQSGDGIIIGREIAR